MMTRRAVLAGTGSLMLASCKTLDASTLRQADQQASVMGPVDAPTLARSGAKLTWGGRKLRLRGVALGDPLDARGGRPGSDMALLASSWRANVVRLSVSSTGYRDHKSRQLQALDRDVQAALAADMWVIIDWHVIGWPDGRVENDWYDSSWPLCLDFWTTMRDRYGQNGRLIFELWNEPLSPTAWDAPNDYVWPELRARYSELVGLIRRTTENLVLCAGDWNSYDLRGVRQNPVSGTNIGYVWPCYPLQGRGDPGAWAAMLDGLEAVAPVVVTEWGFSPEATSEHYHGTAESFGKPLIAFLDRRGLHWIAWCWHPEWGPPMLEGDWEVPTSFGSFVKAQLGRSTAS